jgi:8-oxo-dGTP diphosphatase
MTTLYRNPVPTVDILILIDGGVVLIRRKNPPFGWALPGGFMDEGETCEAAAIREAKEETGLDVDLENLLYVYSDPARDPRKHTITIAFTATATGTPIGMDDALEARIFSLEELPSGIVFDHARILSDYRHFLNTGIRPSPVQSKD